MENIIKFEKNKTYSTPSICDSECIFSITIASRTPKTIVTTEGKRLRISIYDGREQVFPYGKYSMCPIIDASDINKEEIKQPLLIDEITLTSQEIESVKKALVEHILEETLALANSRSNVYYMSDYRK